MEALTLSTDLLAPVAPVATPAQRERMAETARDFEATFLAQMMNVMFAGMETAAPFGGGHGEEAFRSFMTDAMARGMSAAGGVGLSNAVQREMLRMQGLE